MSNTRTLSFRFPLALVLSICCLTTLVWADFETGMDAYQRGNYATALSEWRPLAEEGDAQAQLHLGLLYANGNGVPQNYANAHQWYEQAAAQGYAMAQYNLGLLYDKGDGVPQDYAKARQWYEQAADRGYAMAQTNLGVLYRSGHGVPQNAVRAYMWFSLAAARSTGNLQKPAADTRDDIARRMTSTQIAEAQRLARRCQAQHFKGC
ncbi:MAG: tetratricopeptide repeat protein [Nitrospira sp.]